MLTDGKQIAAARQLLGWSQADLAERAGVSKPSIIRIEKELRTVKDDIRSSITQAFSENNIEFIEGGARINQKIIEIYEGETCYVRLMDDAYLDLVSSKGEILFSGADETRSPQLIINKFNVMREEGIKMRSLIKDGDTFLMGNLDEYRWMDDDLFVASDVKAIFGNKTAYLMTWGNTPRVVIVKDKNIAEENRRLFEYVWKTSSKPPKSTAAVRYNDVKN